MNTVPGKPKDGKATPTKEEIKAVKGSVENLNTVLAEISNNSFIHRTQNVAKSIKQLFTPKK